jgi:hypothetical protein
MYRWVAPQSDVYLICISFHHLWNGYKNGLAQQIE